MGRVITEAQQRAGKLTPEKAAKLARHNLKSLGCIYVHNIDDVVNVQTRVFNLKTLKPVNASPELRNYLTGYRHSWDIELIAVGRDWQGEPYFKSMGYSLETPCLQSELAATLGKEHYAYFLKQIPPNQRINLVWIAIPIQGTDYLESTDWISKVLHAFGALNSTGNLVDRDEGYS